MKPVNLPGLHLEVEDISNVIETKLYGSIRDKLQTKVEFQRDHSYDTRFIGIKGSALMDYKATEKLSNLVNHYCSALNVVGQLGTFMKLDLVITNNNPQSLYFCYLAFSKEACQILDVLIKHKEDMALVSSLYEGTNE
jgi:hypothetical protein